MDKTKQEKEKIAEQKAQGRFGNSLLNAIIAKTFARHSKMSEEEFLKDIGFENSGKTEEQAIRIAKFNLMIEITNQILQVKNKIRFAREMLKTYLVDEKISCEKGETK